MTPPRPPRGSTTNMVALMKFWENAELESVQTVEIKVCRDFKDFNDFWSCSTGLGLLRPTICLMDRSDMEQLQSRVRTRLNTLADGSISYEARANAIHGRVPE